MAGDVKANKRNSPRVRKVTSRDVPGVGKKGGQAREAGRQIEKQKKRTRSALDIARGSLGIKK